MISINDINYYRRLNNEMFKNYKNKEKVENIINEIEHLWNEEERKKLYSISQCHYKKVRRIKKIIKKLINEYNCIFLTLTFNDENYSEDYEILRKKLNLFLRYLRENNIKYIGNFDVGKLNGRGHFHFIINQEIDFNKWKFGAINGIKIYKNNEIALSRYLNKLANHCVKDTVKFRIIRSKKI